MTPDTMKETLRLARLLVEQEQAWDDALYVSAKGVAASLPAGWQGAASTSAPAKAEALKALYERYKDCRRCGLGATRIKFVFGVGNPSAEVLFIGEGPGYEEDRRGEPFVGKAGQLLDKMMAAIGLDRKNAYIANIVKCHPMANPETPQARGNDRPPSTLESETCAPILLQQIAAIQPRFVVTLGSPSTRMILKTTEGITKLRGRFVPFPVDQHYPPAAPELLGGSETQAVELTDVQRAVLASIQVLPTYHPAALLRNPNLKPESWADLKLLRKNLQ